MSIKVMSLVWQDHTGTLDSLEKSILLRMADFAADDGSSIYPGFTRLSKDVGISYRSVTRTIKSLLLKTILIKIKEEDPKNHQAAVFQINVKKLEELRVLSKDDPLDTQSIPSRHTVYTPLDTQSRGALDTVSTQPSLTTTIKKERKKNVVLDKKSIDEEFEEIWNEYPIKSAKENARRAYRTSLSHTTSEEIKSSVRAYKREIEVLVNKRRNDKMVFVPNYAHFATWLNGKRWQEFKPVQETPSEPLVIEDVEIDGLPKETWSTTCKELLSSLGEATFRSWFSSATPVKFKEGCLYLKANSTFLADRISQSFRADFERALKTVNGSIVDFEFIKA